MRNYEEAIISYITSCQQLMGHIRDTELRKQVRTRVGRALVTPGYTAARYYTLRAIMADIVSISHKENWSRYAR